MCVVMLRHNVLHLCCVNQSSKDDYFIVAAGVCVCCTSGGMLCSILVRDIRGICKLVENIRGITF